MGNILVIVKLVIGLVMGLIQLVETTGQDGATKKAQVMAIIKQCLAALPLSGLAATLVNAVVPVAASFGIDFLVSHANQTGAFADLGKPQPDSANASSSSAKSSAKKS